MNRFCKRFFSAFFAVVIVLMVLLSYGLGMRLWGHAAAAEKTGSPVCGTACVVEWNQGI